MTKTQSAPKRLPGLRPLRFLLRLLDRALSWVLIGAIGLYRLTVSPFLGPHCRFQPTCSAYALEAVKTHGAVRGAWLAARRLSRCHPIPFLGSGSGYDPVPPSSRQRSRDCSHV